MTPEEIDAPDELSEPVKKRRRRKSQRDSSGRKPFSRAATIMLWVLGSFVTIGGVGALTYYSNSTSVPRTVQAVQITKAAIRQRFRPQTVITFSPPEWTKVETLPMNRFRVAGWGKANSADGSDVAFTYTAMLTYSTGSWTVSALDMLPQ